MIGPDEEFVPKRRPIDGEINLNGEVFVPLAEYERVRDESGDRRRTLAVAHMHLSFGENSEALRRIETDTGDTFENARAVRSILLSVRGGNL